MTTSDRWTGWVRLCSHTGCLRGLADKIIPIMHAARACCPSRPVSGITTAGTLRDTE